MERGIVAKANIQRAAPNVVTPSAVKDTAPRKGMYIRAGINNKAYIRPNRLPKNLETFLVSCESFLTRLVFTLAVPMDNFFEHVHYTLCDEGYAIKEDQGYSISKRGCHRLRHICCPEHQSRKRDRHHSDRLFSTFSPAFGHTKKIVNENSIFYCEFSASNNPLVITSLYA